MRVLTKLIKKSGLSKREISRLSGVSLQALKGYANGTSRPSLDNLIKLSDFFCVPTDYLLGRCSESVSKEIDENYPKYFESLRHVAYEKYVIKKHHVLPPDGIYAPWPYNLYQDLFKEIPEMVLSQDQIDGFEVAIGMLPERERKFIYDYYKENKTLLGISKDNSITRERVRQIIANARRKLRHPSYANYIKYGKRGVEVHLKEQDIEKQSMHLEHKIQYFNYLQAQAQKLEAELGVVEIPSESEVEDVEDVPIERLGLSTRSYNGLRRVGAYVLSDVVTLIESKKLLNVRNLGKKSVMEICTVVSEITGKDYNSASEV